jgi:iron(III) transport system substrate-binding protein
MKIDTEETSRMSPRCSRIPAFAVFAALCVYVTGCGGSTPPAGPAATTQAPAGATPQAPTAAAASGVSQSLIDAARNEGSVVWYTSVETSVAEEVAKKFEATYSGVTVDVNRTGSERVMQRVLQEAEAGVKAVDVIHTSDAGNFVDLKNRNLLAKYVPAAVEKYPPNLRNPDGYYFVWRSSMSVPAYNPKLISAQDAPRTWQDLLDPRWKSKMVSAHPSYSGTIVTWEAAIIDLYQSEFLIGLARQDVMLVQSAQDPVTKVTSGERPLAINGTDYSYFVDKKKGNPVEPIYPTDGSPLVTSPSAVAADAPHPNAARLFTEYLFDLEAQQTLVDDGLYSGRPDVKYPADRKKLSDLKLVTEDDLKLQQQADQLKKTFTQAFGA